MTPIIKPHIKCIIGAIERRANLMQAELEELRITVEQAEKARKQADAELQAANDRTNELMMEINEHNKEKRQLEMEVNSANAAVEEAINSARSADIAGKKAAADASKMAEQLNREVSRVSSLEAKKKKLEGQLVTMEIKIRELESGSLKGGKKYVMKLGSFSTYDFLRFFRLYNDQIYRRVQVISIFELFYVENTW